VSLLQLVGYGLAALLLAFVLGTLTGNHLLTRHQRRRSRKIAEAQRRLNEARRETDKDDEAS
jgi:hypothetical protein